MWYRVLNRGNERGTVFFDHGKFALLLTLREGNRRAARNQHQRAGICSRLPIVRRHCMHPI
jgi:hypothetical protein